MERQQYSLHWKKKPDLILLDIMLPRVDGLTVCKKNKTYTKCTNNNVISKG